MIFLRLSVFCLFPGVHSSKPTTKPHGLSRVHGCVLATSPKICCKKLLFDMIFINSKLGWINSHTKEPPDVVEMSISCLTSMKFAWYIAVRSMSLVFTTVPALSNKSIAAASDVRLPYGLQIGVSLAQGKYRAQTEFHFSAMLSNPVHSF